MKKSALWKDTFREIKNTKTRFLSIFAITLLGVAFFAGISATGPDMLDTADTYYSDQSLMDLRIQSTLGLIEDDEELLSQISDATVQSHYTQDVMLEETGQTAKVYSFAGKESQEINQYVVVSGRLPENSGEIVLDQLFSGEEEYEIGKTISFQTEDVTQNPEDSFSRTEYEIVGFVNSPLYIETATRGNTAIGSGTLNGFAAVLEEDFDAEVKSEAFVHLNDSDQYTAYQEKYQEIIDDTIDSVETLVEDRPKERQAEIQAEIQEQIDEGRAEIEDARQSLSEAEEELNQAREDLDQGWAEYEEGAAELEEERESAQAEINSGKQELESTREELSQRRAELEAAQAEINQARQELELQRQQINELPEAAAQAAQEEIAAAEAELDANEAAVQQGLQQIEAGEAEVAAAEEELNRAQVQLDEEIATAEAELNNALAELQEGETEYEEGLQEFETERADAEAEIAEAEEDLAEAQDELESVPLPDYYVLDRTSNPGYSEYEDNANRINAIAQVFPVFFFLLAALISLTTMTRMVDEGRSHIGTLKALGYSNTAISTKYFIYAFLATLLGAGIGLYAGYYIFPTVIFDAYGSLYNLPPVEINFYASYALISIIGALIATGGATLVAVRVSLNSNAAILLRPKAPKKGKRIFLERIPFIWNNMSFTRKVAARNLFRYKRRMLMTVFGVAGCTALILTGFGLSDSISDVANLQYGKINQYQAIVTLNTEASEEEEAEYRTVLDEIEPLEQVLAVQQSSLTAEQEGANSQDVTLFVPENTADLEEFILLNDRETGEVYSLSDNGVLISEKLAEIFDLQIGETLVLTDADNETLEFEIQHIVENYLGHMVYASPDVYEETAGEAPEWNTQLLKYNDEAANEDEIGTAISSKDAVAGITFVSIVAEAFSDTLESLDVVTIVLIVSAASLAFIVLYNLTNINVSERIRELSTIKVLGFYNKEVTMYIYRENLVLTLMGIIAGLVLGVFLHQFVLQTAEIDQMMFSRIINSSSYIYSAILTFVFSGIVMIVMHFKLKKVDMIEALKTAD